MGLTFIIVSFIMALSNFIKRKETHSGGIISSVAMIGLFSAGCIIIYYEWTENPEQLLAVGILYLLLTLGALFYRRLS